MPIHGGGKSGGILSLGMEVVIDFFSYSAADTFYRFQIGQSGLANGTCRAEMLEKNLLTASSDTRNLVEWRCRQCLGTASPMSADRSSEKQGLAICIRGISGHHDFLPVHPGRFHAAPEQKTRRTANDPPAYRIEPASG